MRQATLKPYVGDRGGGARLTASDGASRHRPRFQRPSPTATSVPAPDESRPDGAALGYDDLDALIDAAVPASIRSAEPLRLPEPASEVDALAELRALAGRNSVATSMIGQGYYGTFTPSVIVRRLVENPAWYTAYTPYQPEISQGRLEALLNFQTVVSDLTGLPTANASLLDEATAAAEAMTLAHRANRKASRTRSWSTPTPSRRRSRWCARGPRRSAWRWSSPTPPTACRPATSSASCCSTPVPVAGSGTSKPLIEAAHEGGALVAWPRPAGAHPAHAAGGERCRRRDRLLAAVRRPAVLRRPARRVHRRSATAWSGRCRAGWSESPVTPTAHRRTGWHCRPASSTSAGRRRPATSAPRRHCWRSSPRCTRCTTARTG